MLTVTSPPPPLNSGSVCIIYRSLELIQHNSTWRLRSPFLLIGTINTSPLKTSLLLLRLSNAEEFESGIDVYYITAELQKGAATLIALASMLMKCVIK